MRYIFSILFILYSEVAFSADKLAPIPEGVYCEALRGGGGIGYLYHSHVYLRILLGELSGHYDLLAEELKSSRSTRDFIYHLTTNSNANSVIVARIMRDVLSQRVEYPAEIFRVAGVIGIDGSKLARFFKENSTSSADTITPKFLRFVSDEIVSYISRSSRNMQTFFKLTDRLDSAKSGIIFEKWYRRTFDASFSLGPLQKTVEIDGEELLVRADNAVIARGYIELVEVKNIRYDHLDERSLEQARRYKRYIDSKPTMRINNRDLLVGKMVYVFSTESAANANIGILEQIFGRNGVEVYFASLRSDNLYEATGEPLE